MRKAVLVLSGVAAVILLAGVLRFNFTDDDIYVVNEDGDAVKYGLYSDAH